MYEYIRGKLTAKDPSAAVIEAGGIGFRIFITTETFDRLPALGGDVQLLLHHSFNAEQGVERLFGFFDEQERVLFRQLLEVQRIGPSVALRILSNAGANTLVAAIAGGDVQTLKRIKGVGPKMAERLVVELQEPLSKLGVLKGVGMTTTPQGSRERDAISALVSLGYKPAAAEKAVSDALGSLDPDAQTSDLIRAALQRA